jgi:hypothetical protein
VAWYLCQVYSVPSTDETRPEGRATQPLHDKNSSSGGIRNNRKVLHFHCVSPPRMMAFTFKYLPPPFFKDKYDELVQDGAIWFFSQI